ncbi:MAG TPA: DUF393 domain-containing protein [Vulgatibacter sp.]|nr:DUF393 domain-containing protein [Vulgatibacter sp.]
MLQRDQLLVIYDAECGFCSSVARWLGRLDWRDGICCQPLQSEELRDALGMSLKQVKTSAHVLEPNGRMWSEGGAIAACFDALLPFGAPVFRTLYRVPGLHQLGDWIYHLISRLRPKLPHGPADVKRKPPDVDRQTLAEVRRRRLATRMPSAAPPGAWVH